MTPVDSSDFTVLTRPLFGSLYFRHAGLLVEASTFQAHSSYRGFVLPISYACNQWTYVPPLPPSIHMFISLSSFRSASNATFSVTNLLLTYCFSSCNMSSNKERLMSDFSWC